MRSASSKPLILFIWILMKASFLRLPINIIPRILGFSCLILENIALMRHCTIVQMISTYTLNFDIWGLNFSSKKLKLLVSPSLLERDGRGYWFWYPLRLLRIGASALYFQVYEWNTSVGGDKLMIRLGKLAFQKPWLQLYHGLILSQFHSYTFSSL